MAYHSPITLIIFLLISSQPNMPYAAYRSEEALLKLKQSLSNGTALSSWDPLKPPCSATKANWDGLICSRGGNVYGLRLENMGLSGKIEIDALSGLRQLRTISLMNNNLEGPMPNVKSLKGLKSIYFSSNLFEGDIDPEAFSGLNRVRKILLANNKFTGKVPLSLTKVPKLVSLRLEGNQFQGGIPDFTQTSFQDFSLANNKLEGPIPSSLSNMSPDAFGGNKGVCGMPLEACKTTTSPKQKQQAPSEATPSSKEEEQDAESAAISPAFLATVAMLMLILLILGVICKRKSSEEMEGKQCQEVDGSLKRLVPTANCRGGDDGSRVGGVGARGKGGDGPKLCFVKEDGLRFELQDLLKASAEILGSGCFGGSYKAGLVDGTMMVVKRFKQMNNVDKEEFQEHMRRIGRIEHNNVVPLVAYYYRKEEKLLVSSFVQKGSLAMHLHGNNSRILPTLNWPSRLNIIKGVAKGLAHIYKELALLTAPHGHLKSSNILLDGTLNPLIHDYGLIPLINQESAQQHMVAYKSPEFITKSRISKKTDIWSLGIIIIEVMTGQFPATNLKQGSKVDLSKWVKEVSNNARNPQVFDKNMGLTSNSVGEMQKMLLIGLTCCEDDVEKRWDIKEACEKIEEVKVRDNDDDDFYSVTSSSYKSDGDRRSSRGTSDDFTVTVT